MRKNVVITISRQYGSNGQEIGRKLAERLNISYYNKEIMTQIAKEMGLETDFFTDKNEMMTFESRGMFGMKNMMELSVNSKVHEKAQEFIQAIANQESAVIVGRCADYFLKDYENVISIFFYSDIEQRIKWSIQEYNVPVKQAKKIIEQKDKQRSLFYEFYTNQKWSDPKNYTLMINTSKMKTDEIVELLVSYYNQKMNEQ